MDAQLRSVSQKKRSSRSRGSYGPCAYCGKSTTREVEHIVPRCLYAKRENSKFHVLSCRPCNEAKSKTEDDLRDFLAISITSENHPNRGEIFKKAIRSAQYGSSPTIAMARKAPTKPLSLAVGGIIREFVTMDANPDELLSCVEWIARGLFAHLTGKPCPADWPVLSSYLGHFSDDPIKPLLESFASLPNRVYADPEKVLTAYCWLYESSEGEHMVATAMDFMMGSHFMTYVSEPSLDAKVEAQAVE